METRRLFLAVLLSLAVVFAWQWIFPPVEPVVQSPRAVEEGSADRAPTSATGSSIESGGDAVAAGDEASGAVPSVTVQVAGSAEFEEIAASVEDRVTVEGERYVAVFSNRGAQLVSFQLRDYKNRSGDLLDLVRARVEGPYPFGLLDADDEAHPLNHALFETERSSERGSETLVFRYRGPLGAAEKRFIFRSDGAFETNIETVSPSPFGVVIGPGLRNPTTEEVDSRFEGRSAIYRSEGEIETLATAKQDGPTELAGGGVSWVGLSDRYFLTAVGPQTRLDGVSIETLVTQGGEGSGSFRMIDDRKLEDGEQKELQLILRPRGESFSAWAFFGAKQYDDLASLPYGLERTVDFGWFGWLARPLLVGIHWIYENVVANYGWAIVLMTVLIRLALFPIAQKGFSSMQKMQELAPKMQAIRAKYKSKMKDKKGRPNLSAQTQMNEEISALYRSEGVNPLGGCFPMLVQFPVLLAFYNLLLNAVELRGAPWMLWIEDLSQHDPYYVLPIVMGLVQFLQQRIMPPTGDPMQRRIFQLMPAFFTFLFLWFPSGLVLYWLTNNVLSALQQWGFLAWRNRRSGAAAEADAT